MSKAKMQIEDPDLAKVGIALRRAVARAKKIAVETHTPLVDFRRTEAIHGEGLHHTLFLGSDALTRSAADVTL